MDNKVQYIVLNQSGGLVGAPAYTYDAAVKQITTVLANKSKGHQGPFTLYKSVEKLEVEHVAVNLKKTPVVEPPKPEPGYQPEGFAAQDKDHLLSGGSGDPGPAGFGDKFPVNLE